MTSSARRTISFDDSGAIVGGLTTLIWECLRFFGNLRPAQARVYLVSRLDSRRDCGSNARRAGDGVASGENIRSRGLERPLAGLYQPAFESHSGKYVFEIPRGLLRKGTMIFIANWVADDAAAA